MEDKIYVESMVSHRVSILMPGSTIWKRWPKRGAKIPFSRNELIEAYYDPGIEYMFTHGILYTDDMEFKIAVGLEDEDTTEPTKTIKLDDNFMKRMIGLMPVAQFEEEIEKLSYDQRQMLVEYAINHQSELKMDRVDLLDKKCGVHILKSIELAKSMEE